jgi:hypothetical protein
MSRSCRVLEIFTHIGLAITVLAGTIQLSIWTVWLAKFAWAKAKERGLCGRQVVAGSEESSSDTESDAVSEFCFTLYLVTID